MREYPNGNARIHSKFFTEQKYIFHVTQDLARHNKDDFIHDILMTNPFQIIQIADQLDGGLTRSNVLLALRSIDMTNPFQLAGIRFHMDGNKDAYLTEGGVYQQWETAKQSWVNRGNVIDLDGKSKNCNFDQASGVCKLY